MLHLLPDSGTGVHHSIISYIDDFQHIGDYNWAEYVHRVLFSGINSGRTYCIGCAWVLLVWAYEKNPNLQPPNPEEIVPFKKWCRLASSSDNILSCPDLPVLESSAPTIPTSRKNLSGSFLKLKRLEEEVEELKSRLKQESDNSAQLLANVNRLEEENNVLKKKISDLLGEKKEEQNPPKTVPTVVKRIKKRTVKRFAEKKKEIRTHATGIVLPEAEKGTTDIPTEQNEVVKKETKVYRSRRSKRAEPSNTCPNSTTVLIDCYIEIIKAKYQLSGKMGVFLMDSIASQYVNGNIDDPEHAREKTPKRLDNLFKDVLVNIGKCRQVLIPVNKNFHWHLIQIDFKKKILYDYNSLLYKNDYELERWFGWWYSFTKWKNIELDVATWELEVVENFPQQAEDSVDCGIFMLKVMEDLALYLPISFTKDDISSIRVKMAAELIQLCKRRISNLQ